MRASSRACPYCGGGHTLSKCQRWKIVPPRILAALRERRP